MPNDYPIILAHGIARFDVLRNRFLQWLVRNGLDVPETFDLTHYFKGIASFLAAHGFQVKHSSVGEADALSDRAAQLREEVRRILSETGRSKCHIIAHSMGGLDARRMLVDYEETTEWVLSLTTIGTPHLGTSFADWGLANGGHALISDLKGYFNLAGFADLSTAACREFNERSAGVEATNGVFYQALASREERRHVFEVLRGSWDVIKSLEGGDEYGGANDGLVSYKSQLWRGPCDAPNFVGQPFLPDGLTADHLNELGWWDVEQFDLSQAWRTNPFNYELRIRQAYLGIARRLRDL